jgi:hypothetical protein
MIGHVFYQVFPKGYLSGVLEDVEEKLLYVTTQESINDPSGRTEMDPPVPASTFSHMLHS